ALGDLRARGAGVARDSGRAFLAVERLRQEPRHGRLADASGSREQVGVVDATLLDGVSQRRDDRFLPDDLLEGLRAVLAGDDLVAHRLQWRRGGRPEGRSKQARGTCEVRLTAAPFRA